MFGTSKQGFTLIEIVVAIAIVAVMAALVIPNLTFRSAQAERTKVIGMLNDLAQRALYNAITQHKLQRIFIDVAAATIELQTATGKTDAAGNMVFEAAQIVYSPNSIKWPKQLEIKNVVVEGTDLMDQYSGKKTGTAWFYFVPEGFAQDVIINFIDTKDKVGAGKPKSVGLVLNPFSAQFKVYDTFQK